MKHLPRKLLGDTQGAIIAEGVIVLPVFVITLAAMVYLHRAYATKLQSSTKARSCAWSYAIDGCDTVPEGCPLAKRDGFEPIKGSVSTAPLEQARLTGGDAALGTAKDLGLTMMGMDQGVVSRPGGEIQRPSVLGGGSAMVYSDYTVMCNEKRRTIGSIAKDAYCGKDKTRFGCTP